MKVFILLLVVIVTVADAHIFDVKPSIQDLNPYRNISAHTGPPPSVSEKIEAPRLNGRIVGGQEAE